MEMTTEQLKVLQALHEHGSISSAAKSLHKVHTAVIYAMRNMEESVGTKLFDRSGYRTKLTSFGQRLLEEGRKVLTAEKNFLNTISELRSGYELYLRVVIDGAFPVAPVLAAWQAMLRKRIPTKIQIVSDFLKGVEETFFRIEAQLFVSVIPPEDTRIAYQPLSTIKTLLVASKSHPLIRQSKKRNLPSDLQEHTFLTVRGSDMRLGLGTRDLEEMSQFHLSDFSAKREALLSGLGFGWMPEHLIESDLRNGRLKIVRWTSPSEQKFQTFLCHRNDLSLGSAATSFVEELKSQIKRI